jgi:Tfp pilus assembly pilus retraction ATPase PilT
MVLNDICRIAVNQGASDVHLKAGQVPMLRIKGSLVPLNQRGTAVLTPERLTKNGLGYHDAHAARSLHGASGP